jgi:hypothetical protein
MAIDNGEPRGKLMILPTSNSVKQHSAFMKDLPQPPLPTFIVINNITATGRRRKDLKSN